MRRAAILSLTLLVLSGPAFAQSAAQGETHSLFPLQLTGTPEEEAACRPDVVKFCKAMMPDTFRILGCLQSNRAHLRKSCQQVLANRGQ